MGSHTKIRSTLSALLRSNIFFLEKPVYADDMKCTKYNDTHQRKWRMVGSGGYWMVTEGGIDHYLEDDYNILGIFSDLISRTFHGHPTAGSKRVQSG